MIREVLLPAVPNVGSAPDASMSIRCSLEQAVQADDDLTLVRRLCQGGEDPRLALNLACGPGERLELCRRLLARELAHDPGASLGDLLGRCLSRLRAAQVTV